MTALFEDTIRFANDEPLALLRDVTARLGQIADVGGTIHAVDLAFEDAEGSASIIITLTEDQALLLGYAGDEIDRLHEQEIQPGR